MAPPREVPKSVIRFARVCGIFGIFQSVIWIILFALAMASYMNCNFLRKDVSDIGVQDVFGVILHYSYFRNVDCAKDDFFGDIHNLQLNVIMQPNQIFIWSIIGVCFSSIWLIASIYLLIGVNKKMIKHAVLAIYIWSTSTGIVATVDLAMGVLFGITFGEVTTVMGEYADSELDDVYLYDMIRFSALLLSTISFKGFVLLLINIYAAVALISKSNLIDNIVDSKTGPSRGEPIRAYGSSRPDPPSVSSRRDQPNDLWHTAPAEFDINERASFARHPNHERVTSWANQPTNVGSLPFTYLAEPRHVQPSTSSPGLSPNVPVSSWMRNNFEHQPHVPAPDYSPVQNRKLKSALKNGY